MFSRHQLVTARHPPLSEILYTKNDVYLPYLPPSNALDSVSVDH